MTDSERLHQQDLEIIKNLRIFDDDFMRLIFDGNPEATALVLNIIFDRDDMVVTKVVGQREIKGIEGHSVKLDIMATDSEGNAYDIEVQRQDKGNLPLRARYNSSMMDTVLLPEDEDYSKLIPTYVIFFTEKDVMGDNEPMHHFMMQDIKTGHILGDEKHIIFINGDNKDESTRLGRLVHDFHCKSADEMYYNVLAKRMRHFKESEGGITQMCKLMEDMRIEYGKETAIKSAVETARYFGASEDAILENIMKRFDLTESEAKSYMLKKSA
ncbi:MAG: Rpn family recombination-promoting nuclease/putative transposase [Oscillospiraceae bacterium]|nr:Rpn family recombination-promoting nuclease/putative transposase [Oscillospiraceae bacterium]